MSHCVVCNNNDAFIALGKWRQPNQTFSDLISNQVCWECYVAVVHPVDRKLHKAKIRIAAARVMACPDSYYSSGRFRKDMHNVEAWEKAISERQLQRQLYGIESKT